MSINYYNAYVYISILQLFVWLCPLHALLRRLFEVA